MFYLDRLIEREQQKLQEMRDAAGIRSPGYDDMPHVPGAKDRIGDIVPKIVDKEHEIRERIEEYDRTRSEIEDYIESVPQAKIKLILKLRFLDLLPWMEVADALGGDATEYSVKKACYRFVEGRNAGGGKEEC